MKTLALIEPTEAATLILMRDNKDGEGEVLLVKRHSKSKFMANAYVFPGGKKDRSDKSLKQTAIRECQEEVSISLTPAHLIQWSHWITPSHENRRFSAHFFIARPPTQQEVVIDGAEVVDSLWLSPQKALSGEANLYLPPPQLRTLYELGRAGSTTDEWDSEAQVRSNHIVPYLPRKHKMSAQTSLMLPWDSEYSSYGIGESYPLPTGHMFSEGPSRVVLQNDQWKLVNF